MSEENGWISVNDRLPESFDDYLVFCENGTDIAYYCPDENRWGVLDVTHWMEIPDDPNAK
jgi:hypothetical protein